MLGKPRDGGPVLTAARLRVLLGDAPGHPHVRAGARRCVDNRRRDPHIAGQCGAFVARSGSTT
jgi:hypothetical protein